MAGTAGAMDQAAKPSRSGLDCGSIPQRNNVRQTGKRRYTLGACPVTFRKTRERWNISLNPTRPEIASIAYREHRASGQLSAQGPYEPNRFARGGADLQDHTGRAEFQNAV